jgi:hypothetical protein
MLVSPPDEEALEDDFVVRSLSIENGGEGGLVIRRRQDNA